MTIDATAAAVVGAAPAAGSRRADKKERTRQALVEAALELFADVGYDETTTVDIAHAAGVSPRTFFRYFPTKESLLFFGRYDFIRSFTGVFLAQPDGLTDLEAMAAALVLLAPGVEKLRERIDRYEQAIMSSPTLRGREQASLDENAAMIAAAVAERRGLARPDQRCQLLARVGLVVLMQAMNAWLAVGGRGGFASYVTAEFDCLAEIAGRRPQRRRAPT